MPSVIRVVECFDCGQFHRLPPLAPGAMARCRRCHAILQKRRKHSLDRVLALAVAALFVYLLAATLPFMHMDLYGRSTTMVLATGPTVLDRDGMWALGLLVLFFTIAAPAFRIGGIIAVLFGLRMAQPPRFLHIVLRFVEHVRVWSMIEVFLLGVFVAYSKLVDLAHVDLQTAAYALAALMFLMALLDAAFDHEIVWQAMERRGLTADPARVAATLEQLQHEQIASAGLVGCHHCGFALHAAGSATAPARCHCPRCGARVFSRKPNAVARCWALMTAAAVLYVPANLFPVLTAIKLGQGEPATILGGIEQLEKAGMYPLAILVFFASITVPLIKLIGLLVVLLSVKYRAHGWLRDRTTLFRLIEVIGRWSMIDIFMLSVLVAIVRMGRVASVIPGDGAIAFSGVVLLTMLASMAFDSRLMWDAALERRG